MSAVRSKLYTCLHLNHLLFLTDFHETSIFSADFRKSSSLSLISQTREVINALNSIWWHKNITKNRKLYIYQTIVQSILVYGAELWQIPTREINNILSTEMDVLRRSARKSRMERIKNEHIKEIMEVKGKPDIIDIIEK